MKRPASKPSWPRWFTPREVAELLRMREQTLASWRAERYGPPWTKMGKRAVRYPSRGVREWVDARTHTELEALEL